MFAGIADDVGHGRLFPAFVDLVVAFCARLGAGVTSRGRGCLLLGFLRGRKLAKIADKQNELPAVSVRLVMWIPPGGHAGQANAVPDDVVKLAVRKVLRFPGPQIRRLRIEIAANLSLSAAVTAMAGCAAVDEVVAGLPKNLRSRS